MKRWHEDLLLMQNRLRKERAFHEKLGQPIEDCHCQFLGTHRKHKPFEWSSHSMRRWYIMERKEPKRQRIKQRRRDAKREVQELTSS